MKRDLIGMKTVSTHGNYRGNTNLRIITNKQCNYINSVQESGNTGIRSIRRYIIIYYIIDPIRPKITRVTFFYCLQYIVYFTEGIIFALKSFYKMKIATKKNMAKVKGDPYLLKSQTPGKYLNTRHHMITLVILTYAPNTSKSLAFVTNKHFEPVLVCCGFFLTVRQL